MKLRCECDHVIVDQTEDLPYKALFMRDKDWGAYFDELSNALADYVQAVVNNRRVEWADSFFGPDSYWSEVLRKTPSGAVPGLDISVISDTITRCASDKQMIEYQCERCGRVWVQMEDGTFLAFQPDGNDRKTLFLSTLGDSPEK